MTNLVRSTNLEIPDREEGGIEWKGNFIHYFIVPWDLWVNLPPLGEGSYSWLRFPGGGFWPGGSYSTPPELNTCTVYTFIPYSSSSSFYYVHIFFQCALTSSIFIAILNFSKCVKLVPNSTHFEKLLSKCDELHFDWLVGCIENLRRFSGSSAISRLGSRRWPISEIQVARRGIEPRTFCSASQELDHSATAAPKRTLNFLFEVRNFFQSGLLQCVKLVQNFKFNALRIF